MQIFGGGDEFAKKKDIVNPNLFTGSKDFTGDWINETSIKQKDKYLDFTAVCVSWAWGGISQFIAVNKGETFTFSVYAKAKAGSTINVPTELNVDPEAGYKMAITSPNFMRINGTGDWQKISMTFTVTSDGGAIKPRIESPTGDPFWIAGMKLERGTVATPWCPAYADYVMKSDLDALKAEIDQLKQNK